MLDEHNMIMIGGYDCDDCWILNIKTKLWKKVKLPFIDYVYGIINVINKIHTLNFCKPANISSFTVHLQKHVNASV